MNLPDKKCFADLDNTISWTQYLSRKINPAIPDKVQR
jgi:hypothetical protein